MAEKLAGWPRWKALLLLALPLAIGYQLIWQWQFDRLFAEQWSATLFNRLAFAKLSGELLLYGMMWYGMWRYCRPGNRLGWWLICLLGGVLLAVTFRAWLLQL